MMVGIQDQTDICGLLNSSGWLVFDGSVRVVGKPGVENCVNRSYTGLVEVTRTDDDNRGKPDYTFHSLDLFGRFHTKEFSRRETAYAPWRRERGDYVLTGEFHEVRITYAVFIDL